MRVLVAGLRGIPSTEGGVETHAKHLYPLLAEMGCEVEVVVRTPFQPAPAPDSWRGVAIRPLWSPTTAGLEALVHTFLATLYAIRTRPDVFHLHGVGPAIMAPLARLFGVRVVITHHGPDYRREKWKTFARFVLRLGERLGMKHSNGRIVISRTIRDLVYEKFGIDSDIIPNGVDVPAPVDSDEAVAELDLTPGRYVLQVSRFVPEKRQLDLVRAFNSAELRDWRLVFVGAFNPNAPYPARVREAADERVVFAGYRSGSALAELFHHAGVFVLPSSHEGLPIALLEALSHGLPVVASDIDANVEVGLPDNCYFPLGDVDTLARRLEEHARCGRLPQQVQERREWVLERYDWHHVAQSTLSVYEKASGAA